MQNDKPVHQIRFGTVKAAIWKNATTTGGTWYNAVFSRSYRDEKTKEWKNSESFGRDELLVLAKLADHVHTWIHGQAQEERERDRDREVDDGGRRGSVR
jgi:hypothetical protein